MHGQWIPTLVGYLTSAIGSFHTTECPYKIDNMADHLEIEADFVPRESVTVDAVKGPSRKSFS